MAKTTFSGPVQSLGGFVGAGVNNVVTMTAGTTALTVLPVAPSAPGVTPANVISPRHAGKTLIVSDATFVLNLPIINATAPTNDPTNPDQVNNTGMAFEIFFNADMSGGNTVTLNTGRATDAFYGSAMYVDDGGGAQETFPAVAATTMVIDATTRAGEYGSLIRCKAVTGAGVNGVWFIEAILVNPNVAAPAITPFA
tara:strand:- start:394 stop:984 length:591 start_codon:yes stop_codon:yes gene_type:complete